MHTVGPSCRLCKDNPFTDFQIKIEKNTSFLYPYDICILKTTCSYVNTRKILYIHRYSQCHGFLLLQLIYKMSLFSKDKAKECELLKRAR